MKRILTASVTALTLILAMAPAGCSTLRAGPKGPLGQPGPLPVSREGDEAPPPDEQTCSQEISTGSHIAHEVCRTRAQQEREEREAQDLLTEGLQRGTIIIR